MKPIRPPRLATWLLQRLGIGAHNDALLGDLVERYQRHDANPSWYWRQVVLAIATGHADAIFKLIGGHMRRTVAVLLLFIGLFSFLLQGQAQIAIRAASAEPVAGWTEMALPDGTRNI